MSGDDDASDPAVSRFSSIARSCTLLRCRVTATSLTAAAVVLLMLLHLLLLHLQLLLLARCRCCCCGASIFAVYLCYGL